MSDFAFQAAGRTAAGAEPVTGPAGESGAGARPRAAVPVTPTTSVTPPVPAAATAVGDAHPASALRLPVAAALAVASGLALWSSFPSLGWWPMAPVALAGIALACRGQRPRRAFLLGLIAALAFFIPHLHWSGVYVGLLPWGALSTFEGLFLATMCALFPAAWRAPGGRFGTVVALAGLWVAQEAVRGRVPFGGFPWARVAFSQSTAPTLGYAALGGAPLITAAVGAVGALLAVAVVDLAAAGSARAVRSGALPSGDEPSGDEPREEVRRRVVLRRVVLRRVVPVLGAAVVVLLGGLVVPRPVAPARGPAPGQARTVQVAGVQGNVPEAGLEFNAERRAVLDNHAGATERLAADVAAGRAPRPDVVIWPENSSDIDPLRNRDAFDVISRAADAVNAPVLIGAVLAQPLPNVSNASILWGPAAGEHPGPGQFYVKQHPAPFAEYIPYRSFFRMFSDKVDLVRADFAPGHGLGVMSAGPARLGTVICFEVAYDGLVRETVRGGADLLVVQTNNATFGYTDESVQQLAMSRVRAVETGRAVVHVSTVGVSALIAPDGREVARSAHFTQQVLQARLPLRTQLTVATRIGEAPEWLAAGAGVLLAALGAVRSRRDRAGRRTRRPEQVEAEQVEQAEPVAAVALAETNDQRPGGQAPDGEQEPKL